MSVSLTKTPALWSIKWIEQGVAFPHDQTVYGVSAGHAVREFWTPGMARVAQEIHSVSRIGTI